MVGPFSLFCSNSVLTTYRSIVDEDGPKIADTFYDNLFKSNVQAKVESHPNPDTKQAALALHLAVAKLQAEGCSFKRWVPFIHLGL